MVWDQVGLGPVEGVLGVAIEDQGVEGRWSNGEALVIHDLKVHHLGQYRLYGWVMINLTVGSVVLSPFHYTHNPFITSVKCFDTLPPGVGLITATLDLLREAFCSSCRPLIGRSGPQRRWRKMFSY